MPPRRHQELREFGREGLPMVAVKPYARPKQLALHRLRDPLAAACPPSPELSPPPQCTITEAPISCCLDPPGLLPSSPAAPETPERSPDLDHLQPLTPAEEVELEEFLRRCPVPRCLSPLPRSPERPCQQAPASGHPPTDSAEPDRACPRQDGVTSRRRPFSTSL